VIAPASISIGKWRYNQFNPIAFEGECEYVNKSGTEILNPSDYLFNMHPV